MWTDGSSAGSDTGRTKGFRAGSLLRLFTALLVATAFACGDDTGTNPGPTVESLDISTPASTTLEAVDETLDLEATPVDGEGNALQDATVEWSSDAPDVAEVDDSGVVTAVSNGNASITASSGSATASLVVTVEQVATDIVFASPPHNNFVEEAFDELQVEFTDANGHVATNYSDQVTLSIGDNPQDGSLTGQFARDAVDGVASFPGVALDTAGAEYTLIAGSAGLQAESEPFNVTRPSIYVGYLSGTDVTVLDPETHDQLTTVTVGANPSSVAITPDGLHAYVSSEGDGTVSVIETPGNTVTETITVGSLPYALSLSPDGSTLYVANGGDNTVSVIDTDQNQVVETISVDNVPVGLDITPDGESVYASAFSGTEVSVIETDGHTRETTVGTGDGPVDAVVTPDGSSVYVPNSDSDDVSVISTSDNTVVATVPIGVDPRLGAVTPDGSTFFATNAGDDTISRIDTSDNTVSTTIDVGVFPINATVTKDGEYVYVANNGSASISVVEIATDSETETISVNADPHTVTFMPDPVR